MSELTVATYRVAGGYDIQVAEAGVGPVVVFIHGSGPGASGASNFRDNWPAYVKAGFRVILPDMIGYGASSKPEGIDYTLQLFTDTLYEALRAHGVERAALIGNSLGGGGQSRGGFRASARARARAAGPTSRRRTTGTL